MPSIDEILNNLGANDLEEQVKTASPNPETAEQEIEKQAAALGLLDSNEKTASQQIGGETNMNLEDFYNNSFGGTEKNASANTEIETPAPSEGMDKEAAAQLEATGELAGAAFAEGLHTRMLEFTIKTAMDAAPDSEATKERQAGEGVIPNAKAANPQLEVNKGMDDDKGMDTTPEHYSLLSKAVAKAKIKSELASGHPNETSHEVSQAESGLATGGSQKDA